MSNFSIDDVVKSQRAEGPANVLAIGTATPPNIFHQHSYPDFYFGVTNSDDLVDLKAKFQRICEKSMVEKRYMIVSEEFLRENPNMCTPMAPSLDVRQELLEKELPKLGAEAASKDIEEWGQPLSSITHLVLCTSTSMRIPGYDLLVAKLLGLSASVDRVMLSQQVCSGGGTAVRVAKDIAENNKGARVLAVCVDSSSGMFFHGPSESNVPHLVGAAIFGDGASAMVIGSDPLAGIETPIFQIISAIQSTIPNSDTCIRGNYREAGMVGSLDRQVPNVISKSIEEVINRSFQQDSGIVDWNSMFWAVHPGGAAILDKMEAGLGLSPDKLRATRHVLREYGNMLSGSVWFVLDEIRRWSGEEGMATTGEGMNFGVLLGFGPGITVETVVLRSFLF